MESLELRDFFNAPRSAQRLAAPVAAIVLGTQAACKDWDAARDVPPEVCASLLSESTAWDENGWVETSDELAATTEHLPEQFELEGGERCVVQPFNLYDLKKDNYLSDYDTEDAFNHTVVGFSYPINEYSRFQYASENGDVWPAELSANCRDFGVNNADELTACVRVCPEWEGESTVVLTDKKCERVIEIDGAVGKALADIPECLETYNPSNDYCD